MKLIYQRSCRNSTFHCSRIADNIQDPPIVDCICRIFLATCGWPLWLVSSMGGPCGWFPAFAEALQHGWPLWLMWWYSKVTVPGEPLSPIQPFPLTPLSDCTFPCVFPLSCYTVHLSPMQLLPFPPLTPVKSPR